MKKIFLSIVFICILSFNIFSDISENVKENILRQSKDVMKYIFNGLCDTSFVDKTYDVSYWETNSMGGLNGISLVYNFENDLTLKDIRDYDIESDDWFTNEKTEPDKLYVYHFQYLKDNRIAMVQLSGSDWDQSEFENNITYKEAINKVRDFLKRFRPDLENYFLKVYYFSPYNYKGEKYNVRLRIYYKGYQTSEFINSDVYKTGLLSFILIQNPSDYKVPDKIITFEEAREKVKEFIKENYSGDKYYEDVYSKFNFLEPGNAGDLDKLKSFTIQYGKPVFLHANTKIGKYKISTYRDEKDNIKIDYSNVEKYGYTEKDFRDGRYESLFSRLGYLIYIDYPVINYKKKYSVFFVDAETGEIIGGE
ncbi:MAG: hypothetical protein M0R46_18050 [Candidatus Muirbacterium halophilum]|nr:hypothetical protein [Candidatus Muirbacterium halophilum]